MRLRSWLLPVLLATPLLVPVDRASACLRFKKPSGSIKPGMREPSDPPPPPTPTPPPVTPSDPAPGMPGPTTPGGGTPQAPVTPGAPAPSTPTGGEGPEQRKKQGDDSRPGRPGGRSTASSSSPTAT